MKTATLSILSFSLLLLSLPTFSVSDKCNPYDKKVLLEIKQSLNNPYHLASWNPKTDCCDWYSVECDLYTNRITSLTIFSGQISGQIPSAVGDLTYLETLIFRHLSNVTGEIPIAISKLSHLKMVRLSWTNLSGAVPSFFSQLKNLTYLDLSFNDLTGSIPPSLSQLKNLGALHLDRNKLTGKIPDEFGKFSGTVPDLYLSHNQLTGTVPKSLGDVDFEVIDLSRNKLVGDVSFLFGAKKRIRSADFSRNLFEFDLSKVVFPESLTSLDLNHNKIYGGFPAGFDGLELQFLNVSYNRLCGHIPSGDNLKRFDYSVYFHNRCLCGPPLPACSAV